MSGFGQIALSSRHGALCRRARAERARKFKNPKISYIYNGIIGASLANDARSLDLPRSTQKCGDKVRHKARSGLSVSRKNPSSDVSCRCATARSQAGRQAGKLISRTRTPIPKRWQPSSLIGNRPGVIPEEPLGKPVGPNSGRSNRESHRPAHRDRPSG